jgi:isopenicillin-N epimerase
MGPDTRLFFFSHVVSPTGLIMPAKALCEEARGRGVITMVDGAQAPGHIDLNLADLQCDFYAGSGHKWLLGPQGIGFLYDRSSNAGQLEPMQVSWGYRGPEERGASDRPDQVDNNSVLRRFECEGTRDLCAWLALPTAINLHQTIGVEQVRTRMRQLADQVRQRISSVPGMALATPDHPDLCGAMVAFRLPAQTDAVSLRHGLWERFRLEVAVIERPSGLLIRASTHFFNSEMDIDRLVEALSELVQL